MQRIVAIPDKRGAPLQLLAFCAALTVNAVQTKTDSANNPRLAQANTVASALHIDMNQWVTPTAANFFERISKSQIHRALSEAGKTPDSSTTTFKKAQLAETQIAGSSWLPQPLRIASSAGETSNENGDNGAQGRGSPRPLSRGPQTIDNSSCRYSATTSTAPPPASCAPSYPASSMTGRIYGDKTDFRRYSICYQTCFKRSVSVPPRTKPPARAAPLGAVQQI